MAATCVTAADQFVGWIAFDGAVSAEKPLPPQSPMARVLRDAKDNAFRIRLRSLSEAKLFNNSVVNDVFDVELAFTAHQLLPDRRCTVFFPQLQNRAVAIRQVQVDLRESTITVGVTASRLGLEMICCLLGSPAGLVGVAQFEDESVTIGLNAKADHSWATCASLWRDRSDPSYLRVVSHYEQHLKITRIVTSAGEILTDTVLGPHRTVLLRVPVGDEEILKIGLIPQHSVPAVWESSLLSGSIRANGCESWLTQWRALSYALKNMSQDVPRSGKQEELPMLQYFGFRGYRFGDAGGYACRVFPMDTKLGGVKRVHWIADQDDGCGVVFPVNEMDVCVIVRLSRFAVRYLAHDNLLLRIDGGGLISLPNVQDGWDLDIQRNARIPVGVASLLCVAAEGRELAKGEIGRLAFDKECRFLPSETAEKYQAAISGLLSSNAKLCLQGNCELNANRRCMCYWRVRH